MSKRLPTWLLPILLGLMALGAVGATAADLGSGDTEASPGATLMATERYLSNQTLLLMVRATFDVVERSQIDGDIEAIAKQIGSNGPSPEAMEALDRTLLAEASYYIVSLRYVTLVGGAAWPGEKPESTYADDAIVQLEAFERALSDSIETGSDALPVLERVQQLWLLSEGITTVPAARDMFAGRDEIVARALAARTPREDV